MEAYKPDDDGDFEVTAEMLIHDTLDDETSLAVEESLQTREEEEQELNGLQAEGDMPLEQLLALYGYTPTTTTPTEAPQPEPSEKNSHPKIYSHHHHHHHSESYTSSRSRRRRKVVPLEVQKEITPSPSREDESSQEGERGASEVEGNRNPASGKEVSPRTISDRINDAGSCDKTTPTSSAKVHSSTSIHTSSTLNLKEEGCGLLDVRGEEVGRGGLGSRGYEETDSEEVDILEIDDSAIGLVDKGMLSSGGGDSGGVGRCDIVGMGEIEAGLSLKEGLKIALVKESDYVIRMCDIEEGLSKHEGEIDSDDDGGSRVGIMGGEGEEEGEGDERRESLNMLQFSTSDTAGEDEVVVSHRTLTSPRGGRQKGGEEKEGVRGERDLGVSSGRGPDIDGRQQSPVYDDVMLSSGGRLFSSGNSGSGDGGALDDLTEIPDQEPVENKESKSAYVRGSRLRPEIPERRSIRLNERSILNSYIVSLLSDDSGSESDEEYSPQEDWRKEVKVGEGHQASIPRYAPFSPVSATFKDQLVWNCRGSTDESVSAYLESLSKVVEGVSTNPERDHEQALQVLQRCNHDIKTAQNVMRTTKVVDPGMKPWSEAECSAFEEGLRTVRKDFFQLKKKVPTRTVKELVEFYYLWKKTERYDHFIQQYGKVGQKKILIPPGQMSDFMDKYLDMHNSDAMDVHYLTTTVHAEMKRDGYN